MDTIEQLLTDDLRAAAEAADLTPPDVDDILATVAQHRRRRRIRTGLAVAAAALVAAGTVSILTTDNPSRTDISDNPTTTTTEPDPSTTDPTTTTTPTTTTPPPAEQSGADPAGPALPIAEGLDLRPDGLGPFNYGTPMAEVHAAVTAELGAPIDPGEVLQMYSPCLGPNADPAALVVQEVRWDGLTISFSGPDATSLRFVGWNAVHMSTTARVLRMADGPTMDAPVATVWKDVYGDAIDVTQEPDTDGDGTVILHVSLPLPEGLVYGAEVTDVSRVLTLMAGANCNEGG
jgi:hypothetical protein